MLSFRRAACRLPRGWARSLSSSQESVLKKGKYELQVPDRPELFIRTPAELKDMMDLLEPHDVLGIDTEFMTMPFYRPNLEVFQVSSPQVMAAIDVQRLAPQMGQLLEMVNSKEVILHSCNQDFLIVLDWSRKFGLKQQLPVRAFDTQIAAAYLGYGPMIAFKKLLEELYGIEMDKKDTLTDWSRRPLTEDQIKYAINDVRNLHAIQDHLVSELKEAGRYEWAMEEMRALSDPRLFEAPKAENAWRYIFPTKKLANRSVELSVAQEIAKWRESVAKAFNTMPGFLLKNEAVIGLSALQPTEAQQLENIQGIKPRTLKMHSSKILAAVKKGVEKPEHERPTHRLNHKDGGRLKEGLFNLLNSRVQSVAPRLNISPFALAPRQELFDLASVSVGALDRAAKMKPEEFKPLKLVTNFMGVRWDLLPPELNSLPAAVFDPDRQTEPLEVPGSDRVIADPFTEDEEVEMLTKLRVLSGWRRELLGNDLIDIAKGNSLAWDENTMISAFMDPTLRATGEKKGVVSADAALQEKMVARINTWLSSLSGPEQESVLSLTELVQKQLKETKGSGNEGAESTVAQHLDTLQELHRSAAGDSKAAA